MIYKSFEDTSFFEGPTNKTYQYNIEDKDISYCIIDIDGRFPKEKQVVNRKCKEMAHALSGSGILVIEGKKYQLKQNDVVFIDINEKYYWEGKMRLGLPSTPAWYRDQHEIVD